MKKGTNLNLFLVKVVHLFLKVGLIKRRQLRTIVLYVNQGRL